MKICAVIIAGGRSSRMGREKTLEMVGGRRIIDRVIDHVKPQAEAVIINANGDPARFWDTGLPVIADAASGIETPLAGLHAALAHAAAGRFDAALTVPSDAPFLPADLAVRLASASGVAAIACSAGRQHYLTGLWKTALLPDIEQVLAGPSSPRVQDWARRCAARDVTWLAQPYDPFFNINTPDELAEAERIAAEFGL